MLNTNSNTVILKIPITKTKIRFNGAEREVIMFADGFVDAEYEDGSVFPVSNPLKLWVVDRDTGRSASATAGGLVYFELVAAGPASNPGADDNGPSLTNDEFSLNSVA